MTTPTQSHIPTSSRTLILWLDALASKNLSSEVTPYLWSMKKSPYWHVGVHEPTPGYSSIPASILTGQTPDKHQQFTVYKKRKTKLSLAESLIYRITDFLPAGAASYAQSVLQYYVLGHDFFVPPLKPGLWKQIEAAQKLNYTQAQALPVPTVFDHWKDTESFLFYNWPLLVWYEQGQQRSRLTPLTPGNDEARTALFLREMEKLRPDFAFVHLWDLDSVGHSFGPDSPQFQDQLTKYDQLTKKILAAYNTIFDTIVIFSDHGMTPVDHHLDPRQMIQKIETATSQACTWFADSTLLRIWPRQGLNQAQTTQWRKETAAALKKEYGKFGQVVAPSQQKKLGIHSLRPAFYDVLFVLKPGVSFHPTSFARSHQVAGMHGYLSSDLNKEDWPVVIRNTPHFPEGVPTDKVLVGLV